MADYSRIHRLLKILTLIQSGDGWSARRLAQTCGVSLRTIYRDMKMLEGAGIPYFYDDQRQCYQIRRDFFMPPVELTLDESLALVALGEHIGNREQIPLTRPAGRAIAKIRCQLPTSVRQEVDQLDEHVAVELARAGPHEGVADVYAKVRQALSRKRCLRCSYDSIESSLKKQGNGEVFLFKPYALLFSQRSWYAVGHHSGRKAVRNLKLNRFTAIDLTDKSYTIPRSFKLDKHLGHAWRMIRGDRTYEVELRFAPHFAETIADTHWHPTQEVHWHDDQSITFRCKVDGLDEIVWWVLSMGPNCTVLKPKVLARRVRELAAQVLDVYEADERS